MENNTLDQVTARMVYITASSPEEAERIARMLVEKRLAACANILGPIRSFYWWDGKVQDEGEIAMIAKTREELVPALTAAVVENHSYDCPCVVTMPITGGHAPFLEWIATETA